MQHDVVTLEGRHILIYNYAGVGEGGGGGGGGGGRAKVKLYLSVGVDLLSYSSKQTDSTCNRIWGIGLSA